MNENPKYFELEAGCVVYRLNDQDETEYLLVNRLKYKDFAFAKGHVELGEGLEEAAQRETLEETGVSGEIIAELPSFEYRVDGQKKHSDEKIIYVRRVYNFLLLAKEEGDFDNSQIAEGETVTHWLTYDDAMEKLSYENVKILLKQARDELNKSSVSLVDLPT